MNVACDSVSPPAGPGCAPTLSILSHATAPALTKLASVDDSINLPHTVLVSRESCHATRTMLPSCGFGPKKCVTSCSLESPNSVACGVNNTQPTRPIELIGWQA